MKNVIVILFTVMLGVYIGSTFILGDGNGTTNTSFKVMAEQVGNKANGELTTLKSADYTGSADD